MVLHRKALADDGGVTNELRLLKIQHRLVGEEHAVDNVLGQPLEVGTPGSEHVGGAFGAVDRVEEVGAFLAVGGVEMDVFSIGFVSQKRVKKWLVELAFF